MFRSSIITAAAALSIFMTGCEGQRNLDNPDNLDNMPVEDARVEDTADLHQSGAPSIPDIISTATETTAPAAP